MRNLVFQLLSDTTNGVTETMMRQHGVTLITLEAMVARGELRVTEDVFARLPGDVRERRYHLVAIKPFPG